MGNNTDITDNIKYKDIKDLIDSIIELSIPYIKSFNNTDKTPHQKIKELIDVFFPKTKHLKKIRGFHKNVYYIYHNDKKLVLKEGKERDILREWDNYNKIKDSDLISEIYWISESNKFLLQEFGEDFDILEYQDEIKKLKDKARIYNIRDTKVQNIKLFDNKLKFVDFEFFKKPTLHIPSKNQLPLNLLPHLLLIS